MSEGSPQRLQQGNPPGLLPRQQPPTLAERRDDGHAERHEALRDHPGSFRRSFKFNPPLMTSSLPAAVTVLAHEMKG